MGFIEGAQVFEKVTLGGLCRKTMEVWIKVCRGHEIFLKYARIKANKLDLQIDIPSRSQEYSKVNSSHPNPKFHKARSVIVLYLGDSRGGNQDPKPSLVYVLQRDKVGFPFGCWSSKIQSLQGQQFVCFLRNRVKAPVLGFFFQVLGMVVGGEERP